MGGFKVQLQGSEDQINKILGWLLLYLTREPINLYLLRQDYIFAIRAGIGRYQEAASVDFQVLACFPGLPGAGRLPVSS